jgi:type I restriction enzyme M protein
MVPLAEVETNDFNLNLPRYIDTALNWKTCRTSPPTWSGGILNADIGLATYWQVLL